MKKSILILTLLFLTLLPASAIKRIDANPINIAFSLCKETDSANIDSTLEYYGYEPQSSNDGYTVYRHSNGSVIKYSFKDATEAQPYPTIEVKSNRGSNDVDKALTSLDFKKRGSGYIRNVGQHARTETKCNHCQQGFVVFHRTKIIRQE